MWLEWKTAFSVPLGHFEGTVMSFGIAYTLAVFQPLVSDAFSSHFCVCLFSKNIRLSGFCMKWEKWVLPTVSFLEYTLRSERRKTNPECSNSPLLLATKNYKNFWGFYKAKSHPFWLIWLLSQGLGWSSVELQSFKKCMPQHSTSSGPNYSAQTAFG